MAPARAATPKKPSSPQTERALLILEYAKEAQSALENQANAVRKKRRSSGGALTHAEQDLLRAMLILTAAGFDACLKQLVRDSIAALTASHPDVQSALAVFVQRRLRDDTALHGLESGGGKPGFLARVLTSTDPRRSVIDDYVSALTGDSLQSGEQVMRVAKALGVSESDLGTSKSDLQAVFVARNEIVHEMDLVLAQPGPAGRKRRSRTTATMTAHCTRLLDVAQRIVLAVDTKLAIPPSTKAGQKKPSPPSKGSGTGAGSSQAGGASKPKPKASS